MGNANHGSLILMQMHLKPLNTFGIQVVGGFIKQQHIRLLQQQPAQCNAAALAAGELAHRLVVGRALQRIHGALQPAVQIPCIQLVNFLLKFSLFAHELFHLIRVFVHLRKPELQIDFFVFIQYINHFLNTFLHYINHGFGFIQMRLLLQ